MEVHRHFTRSPELEAEQKHTPANDNKENQADCLGAHFKEQTTLSRQLIDKKLDTDMPLGELGQRQGHGHGKDSEKTDEFNGTKDWITKESADHIGTGQKSHAEKSDGADHLQLIREKDEKLFKRSHC